MSVPVHGSVNLRAVVSEPTKNIALPHNIYIGTPDVTTSIAPPIPLPSFLKTTTSERKADNNKTQTDVGLVRVPYPSAKIAEKAREAERASYAYYPGKKFRTKRVFKVIILGNAGVGKTCLSFRFCNGRFPAQTEATIGVDFRERSVVIDGELIRIQLWDTAGQERYRQSIVSHYYRNANAVVFVYDVNGPASFQSLSNWITESYKHFASTKDIPRILIGNKCDLKTENSVKTDHAQMFADANDMALFETSALADSEADHVESIFMTLVHKLQQSKPMHVQSNEERAKNEQKLLLKANDADSLKIDEGWCC